MAGASFFDRVCVSVKSQGAALLLGPAISRFRTFINAGVPDQATIPFAMEGLGTFEVGLARYDLATQTLTRLETSSSSNNGQPIVLVGGEVLYISPRAADLAALKIIGNDGVARLPRLLVDSEGGTDRHWEIYPAIPPDSDGYPTFLISQQGPNRSILGMFQWGDNSKGLYLSFVKSRGDGKPYLPDGVTPNPGYYKATKANDRLVTFALYGSQGANAAHSAYIQNVAAEDCVNNECASAIYIQTANSRSNGNGVAIGPWAQVCVPGPNMVIPPAATLVNGVMTPFNYGANFWIGAGTSTPNGAPIRIDPGPLLTVPEPNRIEYDGGLYITDTASKRRAVAVDATIPFGAPLDSGLNATMRSGPGWLEVKLAPTANYNTVGVIARIPISPILTSTPPVITSVLKSNVATDPSITVNTAANKFTATLNSGTLEAGGVYTFTWFWKSL